VFPELPSLPLFKGAGCWISVVVVLDKEFLRYGLDFDKRLPTGACLGGVLTGVTVAPGRNVFPGPSSWEGSGACSGSRRYFVAWAGLSALSGENIVGQQHRSLTYPVLVACIHLFGYFSVDYTRSVPKYQLKIRRRQR
jgi:hypothetical protein